MDRTAYRVGLTLAVLIGLAACFPRSGMGQKPKAPAGQLTDKSSAVALTMYADAASYQNKSAFDLAAEEWGRFLQRFPDDPLAPKARHYLGVCQVQLKQYAAAIGTFAALIERHPQFEQLEDSYLNLGWCHYSLARGGDGGQYQQAAETFGKLATQFPKGKYVDQALYFEAESLYALGKHKEAALAYGKLVTTQADSKLRPDALYALGVAMEDLSDWGQAGRAYDMFLEDYARHDLATEVRMRKAETVLQSGDVARAEELFRAVAGVERFDSADHALMRQAHCLARLDRIGDAAGVYVALTERYPDSTHVPAAWLGAGRSFYRADRFEEAIPWLTKGVEAGGSTATEAAHWLCRVYLHLQQPDRALAIAEKALAAAADDPFAANLLLDQADALFEVEGRRAEALEKYLALYQAHPEHEIAPLALYDAAFTALDLQRHAQAEELAGKFLRTFPDQSLVPDTQFIIAECQLQRKEYAAAETQFRQLLQGSSEHPQRETWQLRLGLVLYLQQQYQPAIDLLTPLVGQLATPAAAAEAYYLIGVAHYQQDRFREAADSLQGAMQSDAQWRQADQTLLYLARAQRRLDQVDQALATVSLVLANFPDSGLLDQARYDLAEYRYAGDQYTQAAAEYEEVIRRYPESVYVPFALYGRGWSLLKLGEYEAAIGALSTLLDQHRQHPLCHEARFARGMCYRQMEKYAEAVADMNGYLEAVGGEGALRADALYERGLSQAATKDYPQAVASFEAVLKDHPDYADADKVLYELAWAHRLNSDTANAVTTFARLVERFPDSVLAAEANFHVGEDHYAQQRFAEAVEAYRRAAAANNPALSEKVAYKLGWSYYQLKQYRESLAQFEAQLAEHADGSLAADAWFMKGENLFQLKEYAQALPALVEAIGRPASSADIGMLRQLHAGQAALELQKWQEAVGFLSTLLEQHPDSRYSAEAHFERGRARHKLNQLNEATADFEQAASLARGAIGTRAQFMVGEMRFLQKQYEQAIKDFQRAMYRYEEAEADPDVRDWQAKAGYEAGRCSEVRIESASGAEQRKQRVAEAVKFYRYVVDTHPDHPLAPQATARLAELQKL